MRLASDRPPSPTRFRNPLARIPPGLDNNKANNTNDNNDSNNNDSSNSNNTITSSNNNKHKSPARETSARAGRARRCRGT